MTAVQIAERILFGPPKVDTPVSTPTSEGLAAGEALALAQHDCTHCLGLGTLQLRGLKQRACLCVWRGVFRVCYNRFKRILESDGFSTGPQIKTTHAFRCGAGETGHGSRQVKNWNPRIRLNEEYCADFFLLAKRALRHNALGWKLFRFHYLLGADWKLCTRKLSIDRGHFFHECYRVQQTLGKAFAETLPYGIFPVDEYFGGSVRAAKPISAVVGSHDPERTEGARRRPLRAPLKDNKL